MFKLLKSYQGGSDKYKLYICLMRVYKHVYEDTCVGIMCACAYVDVVCIICVCLRVCVCVPVWILPRLLEYRNGLPVHPSLINQHIHPC